jgi:uncharacterized protein
MKWLLVLLVILGGVWWLRQTARGTRSRASPRQPSATPTPEGSTRPMTQCLQCGLHLPSEDAVRGQQGDYCSPAHRQQHEG